MQTVTILTKLKGKPLHEEQREGLPLVLLDLKSEHLSLEEKESLIKQVFDKTYERLSEHKSLKEEQLKEVLHFAHLALLKNLKNPLPLVSLSIIILAQTEENHLLIAGAGHFTVLSEDEVLFQDPLKNVLGRPQAPLFHVRRLMRSDLSKLLILNGSLFTERKRLEKSIEEFFSQDALFDMQMAVVQFFEEKKKEHEEHSSLRGKGILLAAGLCIAAAGLLPFLTKDQPEPSSSQLRFVSETKIPLEKTEKAKERIHIVAQGETLHTISQLYFGTPKRWQDIYNSNKSAIPTNNQLKAGTHLIIPS